MNQASTRSHCIFSVHVTARETGSATIRKAKLHLVDLAGFVSFFNTNFYSICLIHLNQSVLNVLVKRM